MLDLEHFTDTHRVVAYHAMQVRGFKVDFRSTGLPFCCLLKNGSSTPKGTPLPIVMCCHSSTCKEEVKYLLPLSLLLNTALIKRNQWLKFFSETNTLGSGYFWFPPQHFVVSPTHSALGLKRRSTESCRRTEDWNSLVQEKVLSGLLNWCFD